MSRGKKLLGLLMAVGLSVGMSVTPVLAETTSILDDSFRGRAYRGGNHRRFCRGYEIQCPARIQILNCGNVKIQKVDRR